MELNNFIKLIYLLKYNSVLILKKAYEKYYINLMYSKIISLEKNSK